MKMTTKAIDALKPRDKRFSEVDDSVTGLTLVVQPSGKKTWYWRGRIGADKTVKPYRLGDFPAHSYADARAWALNILSNRDRGVDLIATKKEEAAAKAVRDERNVDWLFERYMFREGSHRKARTASEKRRSYDVDVSPRIGQMSISDVDHDVLAQIVQDKLDVAPTSSNRLQALIARMFKWACTKGRTETGLKENPAAYLVKLATEKARTRTIDDYEMGLLLDVLEGESPNVRMAYMLMALTGVRCGNAFPARWNEFNLDTGDWHIAGVVTKNGDPLILPLPPVLIALLRRHKTATASRNSPFLFASRSSPDRHMTRYNKMTTRLRTLIAEAAAKDGKEVAHWSNHDLRRTLRSTMTGLRDRQGQRFQNDAIEALINHKSGTHAGVAGIYNRYRYYDDFVVMLETYADHIYSLRPALRPAVEATNVVRFASKC